MVLFELFLLCVFFQPACGIGDQDGIKYLVADSALSRRDRWQKDVLWRGVFWKKFGLMADVSGWASEDEPWDRSWDRCLGLHLWDCVQMDKEGWMDIISTPGSSWFMYLQKGQSWHICLAHYHICPARARFSEDMSVR